MRNLFTKIFICVVFICVAQVLQAQVSGKVFRDFNANGTFDATATYNENGQSGVSVLAFDNAGASLAVTYTGGGTLTDNSGEYSVSSATPGQVRLEFVLPDGYTFASNGSTGGTSVMFPTTSVQDLAVNTPDDYWDNTNNPDPGLIVPIYSQGTIDGVYNTKPGVLGIKNSASSAPNSYTSGGGQTFPSLEINSPCNFKK